jgi:hypothetical protein
MGVAIGIDSRKSSLAAAVDELGRTVGGREFANDPRGHKALLGWVRAHEEGRRTGIEGSANYGAALARMLVAAGEDVCEVPATLTHRERRRRPARGKSDLGDAVAIARVVARGEGLATLRADDVYAELKLLSDRRSELVCARTETPTGRMPSSSCWLRDMKRGSPSSPERPTSKRPGLCCGASTGSGPISCATASASSSASTAGSRRRPRR